ncbi:flagellar protein FlgN [Clostridium septicum]|uniref:Flagellar protein FlgN n=1 Tax=Clostridium septicum TaxID=1504 RepID=A0ABY5AYD7_CLOSE|nr:flagellar protein FlgN [Clostridium septicum]MDU1314770.1 flagellar protein FlgN [Clostridium septicum]UEC21939.1 flagellar protein FlgN [Clostridium septicum]USS00030.1 flagellar protein FlgN [Clostridium septicum]WLF68555.1 flagellar protein FlgN [Clostridium septicum]
MVKDLVDLLIEVLVKEKESLNQLLGLLDKQYKLIMDKDIFGLEQIVEDIQYCNKEVAVLEIERRKVLNENTISEILENIENENLENIYREIQKMLNEVILQKNTNELLIKQQLSFTNKLLAILNPRREVPIYNSYGNIKR